MSGEPGVKAILRWPRAGLLAAERCAGGPITTQELTTVPSIESVCGRGAFATASVCERLKIDRGNRNLIGA